MVLVYPVRCQIGGAEGAVLSGRGAVVQHDGKIFFARFF